MNTPWTELAVAGGTALLMWVVGWMRTFLARRVAVSSPVERRVKRLSGSVRKMAYLYEALTDRQAMQSQAIILLANGVKLNDQGQVNKAMDVMTASENQYVSSLTAHIKADDGDDEEDDE